MGLAQEDDPYLTFPILRSIFLADFSQSVFPPLPVICLRKKAGSAVSGNPAISARRAP